MSYKTLVWGFCTLCRFWW